MTAPTVHATWAVSVELAARVEQAPLRSDPHSVAAQLTLDALPLKLERSGDADATSPCELTLDFGARALQCKVLQLQISSSARHVELYVDGVRRNLLGEDERGDVYLGTFRGTKASAVGADTQRFDVSEEFKQTTRDHDVLKQIHRLRVKFVSLTGDKNALELAAFKCLYVATSAPELPSTASSATTPNGSAMPSAADVMGMMAGLSVGGQGQPQLTPQAILLMVQQMMEREVEAKIARALDAKLSVLAQRLSFSEQMLIQVQQKTAAKDAKLEEKIDALQQQLSQLRGEVTDKKRSDKNAPADAPE